MTPYGLSRNVKKLYNTRLTQIKNSRTLSCKQNSALPTIIYAFLTFFWGKCAIYFIMFCPKTSDELFINILTYITQLAGELLQGNVSRSRCPSKWGGKRFLFCPGNVSHLSLPLHLYHFFFYKSFLRCAHIRLVEEAIWKWNWQSGASEIVP